MKKGIALVLVLMCCAWVALPALAEAPAFDHTLLEDKEGYSYDKFDKAWTYLGSYIDTTSSSALLLGLKGEADTLTNPPYFMIVSEGVGTLKTLDLLIGDTVTTIDLKVATGNMAVLLLGSNEADFVRTLLEAEELSVRIVGEDKNATFDISKDQFAASDFKEALEIIVQYQLWEDTNWSDSARSIYESAYKSLTPVITVH